MSMNNSNYGFQPTGFSSPSFSSPYTPSPTGVRTQRPRFGYSGPSLYPRPRSSASKPNPDRFNALSDSMINNYGNSPRLNASYSSENENSYNDSYYNTYNTSGSYYSANDSFYSPDGSRDNLGSTRGYTNSNYYPGNDPNVKQDNAPLYTNNAPLYTNNVMNNNNMRGDKALTQGDMYNSGILPNSASQYGKTDYFQNSSYNTGMPKGSPQKNSASQFNFSGGKTTSFSAQRGKATSFAAQKFGRGAKRTMATKQNQGNWRCDLCSLDFTSQIPYDMHIRGAKHAKKLKAKEALNAVQSQVSTPADSGGFFCQLCNVRANSSMQLQTHLEGSKHKNKLMPKEPKAEDGTSGTNETVNAKTNGSLTRPLPSDFGEPQPAKLTKYACDICSITVNSEVQLQQHLSSKKHQCKVEGKPFKVRKPKMESNDTPQADTQMTADAESVQTSTETKMVVGVKTLASSFVQGGTLQ